MSQGDYVLSDSAAEFERVRLQAHVWEPETEAWLDRLGSMDGWHCLDLGCGAKQCFRSLALPKCLDGEGAFVADRLRP